MDIKFEMNEKQKTAGKLLSGDARTKVVLLIGDYRTGKSFFILRSMLLTALGRPGSRQLIAASHWVVLDKWIKNEGIPSVERTLPGIEMVYDGLSDVFRFANGSVIEMLVATSEERRNKVMGRTYTSVYFPDPVNLSEEEYLMVSGRHRQYVDGGQGLVYLEAERAERDTWLHRYFYGEDRSGHKVIEFGSSGDKVWQRQD